MSKRRARVTRRSRPAVPVAAPVAAVPEVSAAPARASAASLMAVYGQQVSNLGQILNTLTQVEAALESDPMVLDVLMDASFELTASLWDVMECCGRVMGAVKFQQDSQLGEEPGSGEELASG